MSPAERILAELRRVARLLGASEETVRRITLERPR